MSSGEAHAVAVAQDLFTVSDDGDLALLATRCAGCGSHVFPQATHCRNPDCPGGPLEGVQIGHRGTLYSWTRQAYQPPALFGMDPWEPYVIGLVELPEGLRVLAILAGLGAADPEIGTAMELVAQPLRVDAEGRAVLTYAYRPARP